MQSRTLKEVIQNYYGTGTEIRLDMLCDSGKSDTFFFFKHMGDTHSFTPILQG